MRPGRRRRHRRPAGGRPSCRQSLLRAAPCSRLPLRRPRRNESVQAFSHVRQIYTANQTRNGLITLVPQRTRRSRAVQPSSPGIRPSSRSAVNRSRRLVAPARSCLAAAVMTSSFRVSAIRTPPGLAVRALLRALPSVGPRPPYRARVGRRCPCTDCAIWGELSPALGATAAVDRLPETSADRVPRTRVPRQQPS